MDGVPPSSFAYANQVAAASDQVPWIACDEDGFIAPESAESRFQAAFSADCKSPFFDPGASLRPAARADNRGEPPPEIVEAALGTLWVRERKACRDPRGFNASKRIDSELYPVPAQVVRDERPALSIVGNQTRFDGRDPVQMYRKLGIGSAQSP